MGAEDVAGRHLANDRAKEGCGRWRRRRSEGCIGAGGVGWGWGMCGDAGAEFAARGFVWRVRGAFQRWWGALGLVHRSWT